MNCKLNSKMICFLFDITERNKIHESKIRQFRALIADFRDFTLTDVIMSRARMKRKYPNQSPLYYIKAVRHDLLDRQHTARKREPAMDLKAILGAMC